MELTKAGIFEAALHLPVEERAELVDDLIVTLYPNGQADLDPAWMAEIERRWSEFEAGKSETYTWEEVKQHLRQKYKING